MADQTLPFGLPAFLESASASLMASYICCFMLSFPAVLPPLLWSSSVILVVTLGFVHIRAYLLRSGSHFSQVALAFGQLVHHIFHIRGREEVSRTLKIVGIAIVSGITGNLLSRTVGFPVAEKLFCHRLNCASLAIDGLCSVSERQPLVEGRVLEGVHAR